MSSSPSTILLRNGLLATFTAADALLAIPTPRRVDVLIKGDTIEAVEAAGSIPVPAGTDALVIDCSDKWIAPGFVDTHRHLWMSVADNHEDWTLSEYLGKLTWTTTGLVTAEDVYAGQLAGALQALHGGTTTILDHFHAANSPAHVEKAIEATILSSLRTLFCIARQSPQTSIDPLEFGDDAESAAWQIAKLAELADKDHGKLTPDGRVTLGLAYDVLGYAPEADKKLFDLARAKNITPITAHYPGPPHGPRHAAVIKRWNDAGALGSDVVMSHCNGMVHGTEEDVELEWKLMKEKKVGLAVTPEDELGMGHGNPLTYDAVRKGVKVGLGIDCASILSTEMFPAMHFALQYERGRQHADKAFGSKPPKAIKYNEYSCASVFRLATLAGAECCNLADKIGSVEPGKLADIVLYDAGSVNLAGCSDPFRGIAIHATGQDVEWVFVNGKVVKKDGKLLPVGGVDWPAVAKLLRQQQQGLRAKLAQYDLEERYAGVAKAVGTVFVE